MRMLQLILAGTVTTALLCGPGGAVVAQSEETEAMAFPTGTFAADTGGESVEFNADGTCRWFSVGWSMPCTYAVNGDLYTEMTYDYPSGPKVPATYYWDYDGETLSFESWGEDPSASRSNSYANHTYRLAGEMGPIAAQETDFPTGTFVAEEDAGLTITFDEDGTAQTRHYGESWVVPLTYGVSGDYWAEMTFAYPGGAQVPATYHWDFDGEHLTFELWGEDLRPHRQHVYGDFTYRLVPDPREVVVARYRSSAGNTVVPMLGLASAAEATDAVTDVMEVRGRLAAVDIAAGQPITLDLLEPVASE